MVSVCDEIGEGMPLFVYILTHKYAYMFNASMRHTLWKPGSPGEAINGGTREARGLRVTNISMLMWANDAVAT